jgi:hypothetical protein
MMSALGKGKSLASMNQANSYELMSTPSHFSRMLNKYKKLDNEK